MVPYLFEKNILLYTFAGLCGLGLLVRMIVNLVYKHLVKESDNLGATKNKMLKLMKMKFETCYKLKIGVNNVDTFVDKNVSRYRFCGVLLSTWDNFGGQILFLNLLIVPICTVFGVVYNCGQDRILFTGAVGILSSAILIFVDKSINLQGKKRMFNLNLLDYLENFCKVRLEQEAFHPELIEQYRKEYFQVTEVDKQVSAASAVAKKEEPKDELNRRREARQKKEEERKLQLQKREEEHRKIEETRKEEEKRKIEEKKLLAAKRREEELLKLEEERIALEARREEIKRKAAFKQQTNDHKHKVNEEKEKLLHSLEEELRPSQVKSNMDKLLQGMDEIAADQNHQEPQHIQQAEEEATNAEIDRELKSVSVAKDKLPKNTANLVKNLGINPQQEKIIEEVLKEFFA
jgi:hypothetical protein